MRLRPGVHRAALSLVEVLVAIGLVAILAMVLVVGVSCSRETGARRNHCLNNLKQIALAMHTYHSTYSKFPIGVRCRGQGVERQELSHSFFVGLLPFVEQANLFEKWGQGSDWANSKGPDGMSNLQRVTGLEISTYRCPSSSVNTFVGVGGVDVLMPSYVGISGATNDSASGVPPKGIDGYADNRESRTKNGMISASGVLVPNQSIRIDDIRDGTTNQIVIAEQSDLYTDASGNGRNFHSGYDQGIFAGTDFPGTPPEEHWQDSSPRVYNLTTVRYAVNYKQGVPASPAAGFSDQGGPGHNAGIVSAHAGVAHVALGDGSVKALSDGIDLLTLYRLCTRDDGGVEWPP